MPKYSEKTVKRLFAYSQNKCAFPGCTLPLVEESGTVTGEICHIKGESKGGPRHDPSQTNAQRNGYENLVLMCARHHHIIDSEISKYPVEKLLQIKREHETSGVPMIWRNFDDIFRQVTTKVSVTQVINNSGQVAVNSPNAIVAQNVTFKATNSKVVFAPPVGTLGANAKMTSYIKYLIDRYNHYLKLDPTKPGRGKYPAFQQSLKKEFGQWQMVDESRFEEVVTYLKGRIDKTYFGRNIKSRGNPNYHSFEEHGQRKKGKPSPS